LYSTCCGVFLLDRITRGVFIASGNEYIRGYMVLRLFFFLKSINQISMKNIYMYITAKEFLSVYVYISYFSFPLLSKERIISSNFRMLAICQYHVCAVFNIDNEARIKACLPYLYSHSYQILLYISGKLFCTKYSVRSDYM
jgi:hypothetical protein